jgi:hypothetical protein
MNNLVISTPTALAAGCSGETTKCSTQTRQIASVEREINAIDAP